MSASVLVCDDDAIVREMLTAELEAKGVQVSSVATLGELRSRARQRTFDLFLIDLFLGEENGLEAVPELIREFPYAKVVVMSANGTVELAADAMEMGATTFLSKGKDAGELIPKILQRLEPRVEPKKSGSVPDWGIIGKSASIRELLEKIDRLKNVDTTVLISGESGTGKELVARALHGGSNRSAERFEALNCGAIPENLLESELFGHRRGAFTDAKQDRKGLFEICSKGTLFLDEVGETPATIQVKLLRVLQEREIQPLGSSETLSVETRVLAATNRVLADEVGRGTFRNDLFYRLNVLNLHLAPLRERKEDIPLLLRHFVEKFAKRFNRDITPLTREIESRLAAYPWPGNVRELQNSVERGVILASDGVLRYEDMIVQPESAPAGASASPDLWTEPLNEAKRRFEQEYLKRLLELTGGNVSEVARLSGRYRTDIHRLLQKYHMDTSEFRN